MSSFIGVTGLRTSAGKSRMLGDKISGLRGEKLGLWARPGMKVLIMRPFLRLLRRSYSLKPCFFVWPVLLMGGMPPRAGACLGVSEEPVSICTTCLKVVVSACTKVVG